MHLLLHMDPLKHECLFGYSGPRPSKVMSEDKETVEVTREIATLQLKDKRKYWLYIYHQKSCLFSWGQVKALCTKGEVIYEAYRTLCQLRIFSGNASYADVCICRECLWARVLVYGPHPPLFHLVDQMGPAPVFFISDSVFMSGHWYSNSIIHLS